MENRENKLPSPEILHRLREQFDAKLLKGLTSGEPVEATAQLWQDLKRKARRHSAQKQSRSCDINTLMGE